MFGRRGTPRAVVGSVPLGRFVVHNPDPTIWLPIPADFRAPGQQPRYEWGRDQAAAVRANHPDVSKDDALAFVMGVADDMTHRFVGHDQYWSLLKADVPSDVRSVTVVFDVLDAGQGSAQRMEQALLTGSDPELEKRPDRYQEQPTGPGQVADVAAAGLGRGRCIVRRDRHQVFGTPLEQVLNDTDRTRYRDPAYWDQAISVHWIFDTPDGVLRASVRTDHREVLLWAMPKIHGLLDGITSTDPRPTLLPQEDDDAETLVYEAAAAAAADEQAIVSRHHHHRR